MTAAREELVIPNRWYAILESKEVKAGKPLGVTRLGEKLVLWRDSHGTVTCMRDLCPHRGVALSAGKVLGDQIQCPFHGFEYDAGGECRLIPANGRTADIPKAFQVRTYSCSDEHGFIWVWWGEPRSDLPPVPFFESIDHGFSQATIHDKWSVHYSRAIENQLDAVHLPFVHRTTIGAGNRTVIDGPQSRLEGDRLDIWVHARVDDGTRSLRAEELPVPQRHPSLQFHFPNVWHNWISDDLRIVAAFAPIDEETTMIYVRSYQRMVQIPVLREVYNAVAAPFNRIILNQDKRVVTTQRPVKTSLRMGEKLIPGDGPIVAYRRRRDDLIASGGV